MDATKKSVLEALRQPNTPPVIIGHDIMALERFAEDTRHMIVFGVNSWDCPVGDKGQHVRIFLTNEGYLQALRSQERGEMKIKKHAHVSKGYLFYNLRASSEAGQQQAGYRKTEYR